MNDAQMNRQIDEMYIRYLAEFGRDSVATRKEVDAILDRLGSTNDALYAMLELVGTPCKTDRAPPAYTHSNLDDLIARTGRSK